MSNWRYILLKKHTLHIKLFFVILVVFTFLATGCMPPETEFGTPEFTGVRSAATEGHYIDRVGVSWSKVEGAATYTILRGTSKDGPFEEIDVVYSNDPEWLIENAGESVIYQPPPVLVYLDGWVDFSDPGYLNVSYTSEVDLTKGKFIAGSQTPQLRIIMGSGLESGAELNFVVFFPGGTWGKTYTIDDIVSAINGQANGKNICEVDSTGKHLKFSSEWGPIAFINEKNTLSYSPVRRFIKEGVGEDQMLIVNKDGTFVINENDFTGNMNDYLGAPIPVNPGGWVDFSSPAYLDVLYTTNVDLSKGKFIAGSQTPELRIIMGILEEGDDRIDIIVDFPGGLGGETYDTEKVMSRINNAVGKNICEVDSGKYLKFSSECGPIAFINEKNSLSYSPVRRFIKEGVGTDQMLIVNKDGVKVFKKDNFTGNMADYLGKPILSDPDAEPVLVDPDPVVIMRNFQEGDSYYYDDMKIELGVHYFYRVVARGENGSFLSMSPCMEGYYVSASAPSEPKNVTVSQGDFSDKVEIYWDTIDGDDITYNVYRALVYPGTFDSAPLAEGLTETFFEDIAAPAGVYAYRIVAYNKDVEGKPQEGRPSDTFTGFRSITLDEFVHLAYYETVRAEQRMAQALGKPRVADYDSGANANVTLPGNISGTVNYNLSVKGFSGTGTWTFADYSNFGFIVTGKTAMDSGMSKNGDVRGMLTFSGPYPGYLDYYVHVSKGNPSEGSNSYFKVQLYSPEWMIENYGSAEKVVYFSEGLIQSPY